ncbi:glycosyltransferase family 2 protein [Oceanicola sp. S124]|uniref:glycosyltransferase family 2 protein n=1 Tax=Oceanicola sp. S124 TaxID=1042378 RepID=UPI00143A6ACE|nr:glycosyltransferase family A protein [Oceanicola sp. S124]
MPFLTSITPFHSEGARLRTSLDSLLAQDFGDVELLLVDDGADARTRAVAESYSDPRIRILRGANGGLSSARNRGIAAARGRYLCFLDADDSRPIWAFSAAARQARDEAPDLVICQGHLAEETGQLMPFYDRAVLDALEAHLQGRCARRGAPGFAMAQALCLLAEPQSANKLVRRDFLGTPPLGFPPGHVFEDLYFHALAVARAGRISLCPHPAFTYHRHVGGGQLTAARDLSRFDILAVARLLLTRFAALPEAGDPLCRTALMLALAKLLRWCEEMLSHPHRAQFRTGVLAVLALADPRFRRLARQTPVAFDQFSRHRDWLEALLCDPRLSTTREVSHDPIIRLPRLWPGRRA